MDAAAARTLLAPYRAEPVERGGLLRVDGSSGLVVIERDRALRSDPGLDFGANQGAVWVGKLRRENT